MMSVGTPNRPCDTTRFLVGNNNSRDASNSRQRTSADYRREKRSSLLRRINSISISYFKGDLCVRCSSHGQYTTIPHEAMRHLHRSCNRNPSLWPLCRGLTVSFPICIRLVPHHRLGFSMSRRTSSPGPMSSDRSGSWA